MDKFLQSVNQEYLFSNGSVPLMDNASWTLSSSSCVITSMFSLVMDIQNVKGLSGIHLFQHVVKHLLLVVSDDINMQTNSRSCEEEIEFFLQKRHIDSNANIGIRGFTT